MGTAYILFSADVRKITMDENPGVKFGEISRIVAERWRQMTDSDKSVYAERAKKLNDETEREEARKAAERANLEQEQERLRKQQALQQPPPSSSPSMAEPGSPGPKMGGSIMPDSTGVVHQTTVREREGPIFHAVPPRP